MAGLKNTWRAYSSDLNGNEHLVDDVDDRPVGLDVSSHNLGLLGGLGTVENSDSLVSLLDLQNENIIDQIRPRTSSKANIIKPVEQISLKMCKETKISILKAKKSSAMCAFWS